MPVPFHAPGPADPPPDRPALACTRLASGEWGARLKLVGELDLLTADLARATIERAQSRSRPLVCDLHDVWFIDVSGLRVLLDAGARAAVDGERVTLLGCPAIVPRMLRLLGLEDALDVATTRRPDYAARADALLRRHLDRRG